MIAARNSGCLIRIKARIRRPPSSGVASISIVALAELVSSLSAAASFGRISERRSRICCIESVRLGSFSSILPAPYELRPRAEDVFWSRFGSHWLAADLRPFSPTLAPKIDTYFSGMCNFPLTMRLRQAAREIAWRSWRPWRRLLKLSSASPGVEALALHVCQGRYRSEIRARLASAIAIARKARIDGYRSLMGQGRKLFGCRRFRVPAFSTRSFGT
jgi:hypothetical protein